MDFARLYIKYPSSFNFSFILLIVLLDLLFFEQNIFICRNKLGIAIIFLHRLSSFLMFATPFLFGFYRLHILIVFIISVAWIYNGGCYITDLHNNLCGITEKYDNSAFTRLFDYLGIDLFFTPFIIQTPPVIYDLYMIYNGK